MVTELGSTVTMQMGAVYALILVALVLYATEKLTLELTSAGVICALLVLFQLFPVTDETGRSVLNAADILAGFANPALIAVLALLILGEGLNRTGALDQVAVVVHTLSKGRPAVAIILSLVTVMAISALLNNIPVVVIFIPIMQALAIRAGHPASRYMMPLSFAAILGGMTTLIGSSTNLLVSSALIEMGEEGFSFFSFTIPGLFVAAIGMIYVTFVLPRILPERQTTGTDIRRERRQFKAQLTVREGSHLEGMAPTGGFFPELKHITVLSLERNGVIQIPPYDDGALKAGDVMVIAATREYLTEFLKGDFSLIRPDLQDSDAETEIEDDEPWTVGAQSVAEVMVRPNSGFVGGTIEQTGFRFRHNCAVIGVERRSRMMRQRITDIVLEEGDILLIQGQRRDIDALRYSQDVVLMEWSAEDIPQPHHARRATLIFLGVVGAAGTGILPTEIAALCGAAAMVLSGAITTEEAIRALDHKIILLIAAALAMGVSMQATGGAAFIAHAVIGSLGDAAPAIVLSGFFLMTALLANVLSTKATAVLFTPIAVALAYDLGVPAEAFAVAVVFAANCSFASPVGYQTNLLVMAPGGYRFMDFVKAGLPLLLICWLAFSFVAPWYYGL